MNEAEFNRSIGEILAKKLLPETAKTEAVKALFDHPHQDNYEIRRATRIAVFGALGGAVRDLRGFHLVNRLFAFWAIVAGLKSNDEAWRDFKTPALKGAEALMFDYPEYGAQVREVLR